MLLRHNAADGGQLVGLRLDAARLRCAQPEVHLLPPLRRQLGQHLGLAAADHDRPRDEPVELLLVLGAVQRGEAAALAVALGKLVLLDLGLGQGSLLQKEASRSQQ